MTDLDALLKRVGSPAPSGEPSTDRDELADQLQSLLDATEQDADGMLRELLAAYVAGLRGEMP